MLTNCLLVLVAGQNIQNIQAICSSSVFTENKQRRGSDCKDVLLSEVAQPDWRPKGEKSRFHALERCLQSNRVQTQFGFVSIIEQEHLTARAQPSPSVGIDRHGNWQKLRFVSSSFGVV